MYRTRRFLRGSAIFKQGHHDETAFLIRSGRVSIVKQFAEREVHLCTLGPGALFGEMAVLGTGRRTASAVAEEECELVEIRKDQLEQLLAPLPLMVKTLMQGLAERLRQTTEALGVSQSPEHLYARCLFIDLLAQRGPERRSRLAHMELITGLKEIFGLASSDAQETLKRLVEAGLLTKVVDPQDGLQVDLGDPGTFRDRALQALRQGRLATPAPATAGQPAGQAGAGAELRRGDPGGAARVFEQLDETQILQAAKGQEAQPFVHDLAFALPPAQDAEPCPVTRCLNRDGAAHTHVIAVSVTGILEAARWYGGLEVRVTRPEYRKDQDGEWWWCEATALDLRTRAVNNVWVRHPYRRSDGKGEQVDPDGMLIAQMKARRDAVRPLLPPRMLAGMVTLHRQGRKITPAQMRRLAQRETNKLPPLGTTGKEPMEERGAPAIQSPGPAPG